MMIVTADVAAKWFLPETGSDQADQLLRCEEILAAPSIIRVQTAAAITQRVHSGELTADEARQLCTTWHRLLDTEVLTLLDVHEFLAAAVDSSLQLQHSLVDCLYLAAAQRYSATLVTTDTQLAKRGKAVHSRIILLSSFARKRSP